AGARPSVARALSRLRIGIPWALPGSLDPTLLKA
ncbi:MAG: hypothetical protein JWL68_3170, partial [Actinomycetia bacterium]|nr:hypothetical protein [Actinomycetes bacterium]